MDTADIATLNDALGSAGVDLRVCDTYSLELLSFSLGFQRQKKNLYSGRTSNISPTAHTKTGHANNLSSLHSTLDISGATMRTVGTQHKVTRIPDDSVNYLALALRARLQTLVEQMVAAANHRTDTQIRSTRVIIRGWVTHVEHPRPNRRREAIGRVGKS